MSNKNRKVAKPRVSSKRAKLEESFIFIRVSGVDSMRVLGKERRSIAAEAIRNMRRMARGHNLAVEQAGKENSFTRKIERQIDSVLHDFNSKFSEGYNRKSRSWKDEEAA